MATKKTSERIADFTGMAIKADQFIDASGTAVNVAELSPLTSSAAVAVAFNKMFRVPVSTVAAAGSALADATQMVPGVVTVTGLDNTVGVKLPATPAAGTICIVIPTTSAKTCPVYPDAAATINAIGSNGAITLVALKPAFFIATSTTQWYTIPLLPS